MNNTNLIKELFNPIILNSKINIESFIYDNYMNIIWEQLNYNWIYFSIIIFLIGLNGIFLGRKNIIIVLMSLELILLSIMILFVFFSINLDDISGQLFTLFIVTVGASESAIGLSLIVSYYRLYILK